ncbi:MAG: ABC transporter substrate-binding protein [Acidaminobacteraceae bacterium]
MKAKAILNTIFLLIITVIIVSSCSSKKDTILIGVVGTMTGESSDLAVSGRRGIEIAVDEINSSGGVDGRKIELVIKNDENKPETALLVNQEFVEENVKFVIGHYTSEMQIKTMDYINQQDILFLSPTVSADLLTGIDDNIIRYIASTKEQAVVLAKVAKKNKHKKFAIFTDSNNKAFNQPLKDNFSKILSDDGGEALLELEYDSKNIESFIELVDNLEVYSLDAIFMIGNSASNAKLAQLIKKRDINISIYAPLWANTHTLVRMSGNSTDGMYIVGSIDEEIKVESYSRFKEKYIKRYGEKPSFSSVYSYEAAQSLFNALSKTKDHSPDSIKKMIVKIRTFDGLQGSFNIDKFGDNTREYLMFEIIDGKLVKVKF